MAFYYKWICGDNENKFYNQQDCNITIICHGDCSVSCLPMFYLLEYSMNDFAEYRKVPKFSDANKLGCNLPKIQEKRPNLRVFHQNADVIANSEDPDQTAPLGAV